MYRPSSSISMRIGKCSFCMIGSTHSVLRAADLKVFRNSCNAQYNKTPKAKLGLLRRGQSPSVSLSLRRSSLEFCQSVFRISFAGLRLLIYTSCLQWIPRAEKVLIQSGAPSTPGGLGQNDKSRFSLSPCVWGAYHQTLKLIEQAILNPF